MRKEPRGPVAVERGKTLERTVFRPGDKPLTEEQLHQQLDPIVRDWLGGTCVWKGDELGDYRFLIFYTDPTPDVQVYVQFWSEPGEPVLCEVSSGRWHEATAKWLHGRRVERIRELGFATGGEAENFQREFEVKTSKDLADAAEYVAKVFFHSFDYRGETPIEAKLTHDGRAEARPTYDGFTVEEMMQVFAAQDFAVDEALDSNNDPTVPAVLRCTKHGVTTIVDLEEYDEENGVYGGMRLTGEFAVPKSALAEMRRQGHEPPEGLVEMITIPYRFTGGVTLDWLIERVEDWDVTVAAYQRKQRRRTRAGSRSKGPPSPTVH